MKTQKTTLGEKLLPGCILFSVVLALSIACIGVSLHLHSSYPEWISSLAQVVGEQGEKTAESDVFADDDFLDEELNVWGRANDRLVSRGENLREEERGYKLLQGYKLHCDRKREAYGSRLLHSAVLVSVLLLVFSACLAMLRDSIALSLSNQILCAVCVILHILFIGAGLYVFEYFEIYQNLYLAALLPSSMAPALMSNLLGRRVGICSALLLSALTPVLVGVNEPFPYFLQCLACSSIAVMSFQNVQRRKNFLWGAVGLVLALVASVALLVWHRGLDWAWHGMASFWWRLLLYSLAHAVLVVLAVLLFPMLFERFFDVTTEFTLIELLVRDHPLLVRLRDEAAGTDSHSMDVAEIVYEAALAIHANAKLAKVCAYFHDVGKLFNPKMFAENLEDGEKNPHDELTPAESCKMLRRHTEYGLELTKAAHLPRAVQEACASHHGNGLMSGFYAKAQALAEEKGEPFPDRQEFCYRSELPSRPEVVLIEMADSAEAASRAWIRRWTEEKREITTELMRESVEHLLFEKMKDHQFDNAELTMEEFHVALEAIVEKLCTIHHSRPKYSTPKEAETPPEENGGADAG